MYQGERDSSMSWSACLVWRRSEFNPCHYTVPKAQLGVTARNNLKAPRWEHTLGAHPDGCGPHTTKKLNGSPWISLRSPEKSLHIHPLFYRLIFGRDIDAPWEKRSFGLMRIHELPFLVNTIAVEAHPVNWKSGALFLYPVAYWE